MALYVESADGVTPGRTKVNLPSTFIRKLDGSWSIPTVETAEQFGWFPVVEEAQPSADHVRTIAHDGTGFVTAWTFDPAAQTARLAAEAQDVKRQAVTNAVATLRQWADDAEATTVTSGNAVATLNTVVDRLGVFFDRFADLVESRSV